MDAIFLHSGWRTAGTLFWHCLRAHAACKTFYEPLHESLAGISAEAIGATSPASWNSRHPLGSKAYFEEYQPLLNPDGGRGIRGVRGVQGALSRFAFDDFFMPAGAPDAALGDYIEGLCDVARRDGKLPVLKFTRSLARLPWFRARFARAVHPVVIRQPWAQFRSAWRVRTESRNGYFLAAPFLILERNTQVPEVAALIAALGLPVRPGADVVDPLVRLEFWRLAVQRMTVDRLYRASFALWLLNYARALPQASFVLDMATAPASLQVVFARHTGLQLALGQAPVPAAQPLRLFRRDARLTAQMISETHEVALAAVADFVDADHLARLMPWIDRAAADAARDLASEVAVLPRHSVPASTVLLLNTARRWINSHPGFSLGG